MTTQVPSTLPADDHVHTEWSWDAAGGSMDRSCARALELGLPSIAFTEHVDASRWVLTAEAQSLMPQGRVGADGRFDPPSIDTDGYRAVLHALAGSGRALEVNTRLPMPAEIVGWWYEVGGDAVSAAMVDGHGFRPGRGPHDFWRRRP